MSNCKAPAEAAVKSEIFRGWVSFSVLALAVPLAVACSGVSRIDAGAEDAGEEVDSGPADSGPTDSGPTDSGPTDSGPMDGGTDAGSDSGTTDGGALAPDMPVVDGETSAGHDSPSWLWNEPSGTAEYEYRLDGGAFMTTTETSFAASGLSDGAHTFEVRACNADGACSALASFSTTIEKLGPGYPDTLWDGVARSNLATSPLGNVAPIACHNCYNGAADEVLDTTAALAKINLAVSNGADLIELDVSDTGGTLCVHSEDPLLCTGAPTLSDVLADSSLRTSDALLFVEIVESSATPAAFATQLLDELDANRDYAKNGRFFVVRAVSSDIPYLEAIRTASADYPLIAPYLRYSVRYPLDTGTVGAFQAAIQSDVADNNFDMVEVHFQQTDFFGVVDYARAQGLAVALYPMIPAFGHALISSVRENVDQITSEFIVTEARRAVEDANLWAYVNARDCASAADTTVPYFRNPDGTEEAGSLSLGIDPTASMYGAPTLLLGVDEDWVGCTFDYRTDDQRALNLGEYYPGASVPPDSTPVGYLLSVYLNFDDLSAETTQTIVGNTQVAGVALELVRTGGVDYLQFSVRVGDEYIRKRYDVASTGLAGTPSLNGNDGYHVVGVYDGTGAVHMWINGEQAGPNPSATGPVVESTMPFLLGADPDPAVPGANQSFDGLIQSAMVLRWENHDFSGPATN